MTDHKQLDLLGEAPPQLDLLGAVDSVASTPPAVKPVAEKPAAEKPAAEKPAAEKPAAEKPVAEKPVAEKPAAEKPAAEKPAAEKQPPARAGGQLTSETHPIRVGWVPVPAPGKLGLAYCPGRKDVSRYTGAQWMRAIDLDLARLREEYEVGAVAILAGPGELEEIGAGSLVADARAASFAADVYALTDASALDAAVFGECVEAVLGRLRAGEVVAVLSRGGQGRTGAVAAAVLVALGASASEAVAALRELRGPHCVHAEGEVAVEVFAASSEAAGDVAFDFGAEAPLEEEEEPPMRAASEPAQDDPTWLEDSAADRDPDWEASAPFDAAQEVRGGGPANEGAPSDGDASTASAGGEGSRTDSLRSGRGLQFSPLRTATFDRVAGVILGGAIGDAIGHPTEFVGSFEAIRKKWPPNGVTGFELWWERDGDRFAPYTDDTQMAEAVLRSLLWSRREDAGLDATMKEMASRFVAWAEHPQGGHRAPGNACLSGCRALASGVPWQEAGGATAGGCGSVMRAYPFGLIFHEDLRRAERWAVAHSKLTHRDPIALAASAAMAVGIARALRGESPELVLSEMVAAACRYSPRTAAMMATAIEDAHEGTPPEGVLDTLQGWAAHEAIAATCYLFARHPNAPREAILEGANSPGDSDSLATLVGALCGARGGLGSLPTDWVRDVERSTDFLSLAEEVCR